VGWNAPLLELGRDDGTAAVIANREVDGYRVRQARQVRAFAIRLELEVAAPQELDRRF
jgi:hypothetical protein